MRCISKTLLFVLCFCIAFLFSCNKKDSSGCEDTEDSYQESNLFKKTTPEYDSERQVIYFKKQIEYDIKVDLTFADDFRNLGCAFSFFNYGNDIKLYNGLIDDAYLEGFGEINSMYHIKDDNIHIISKYHNKKYGDWALVSLPVGNSVINSVFMTPLALKAYKNEDTDNLIFVQFLNGDYYMNVLFVGSVVESFVLDDHPKSITQLGSYLTSNLKDGPGQFWHKYK